MDTKLKKLLNEDFDGFMKEIGQEHLLSADVYTDRYVYLREYSGNIRKK